MTTGISAPTDAPGRDRDDYATIRWFLAAVLVVSLGWIAANLVWPTDQRAESMRLSLAEVVSTSSLLVLLAAVLIQGLPYRPAPGLRMRGQRAFTVPANVTMGYLGAAFMLVLGGQWSDLIHRWRVPDPVDPGAGTTHLSWLDATDPVHSWLVTALGTLAVALLLAYVLGRRGSIELTSAGVAMRDMFGTRSLAWDALRAEQPVQVTPPPGPRLTFLFQDGQGWRRAGFTYRSATVGWPYRSVTAAYFAEVVTWYVRHPEQRAGIGSGAGYVDLIAGVGPPETV